VTGIPRAILAVDAGAATTAVAILGRQADRWRVVGALAGAAPADPDDLAAILANRIRAGDSRLAETIGVDPAAIDDLPRLEARSAAPATLGVIAASRRAVRLLESVAERTAWRVVAASPESHDPREMTDLALRPEISALLVGATEPPGPDERAALDDVAGLVAAVLRRRPELRVVVAGPITTRRS
jgi:hypothetical protein